MSQSDISARLEKIKNKPYNKTCFDCGEKGTTYVAPFKLEVAKELIERELGRNGQIFFLHNNVSTLAQRANSIHKLIPDARIGIAHGQMERDEIEDVMMKFYNGEIDILVCTSIVENGIDVPNANMIMDISNSTNTVERRILINAK